MDSWTDIINYQLSSDPDKQSKFWAAFQAHDDVTLRTIGGLAYAYWADIQATEPNETLLKQLARLNPKAFIQVYHGLKDGNTIAQPVMDFENWNRDRLKQNKAGWNFQVRYYQADHGLNLAAVNDMIFALLAYLTP